MKINNVKYILLAIVLLSVGFFFFRPEKATFNDYTNAFTNIYDKNMWGGSGPGSDPTDAKLYLEVLQQYFNDPRFNTIVDFGCGDWRLMEHINVPANKTYKGFDVVQSVIDSNTKNYGKSNIQFYKINTFKDFLNEKADLIIVKDVLMHLPSKDVKFFIDNILPNFKYALITHAYEENKPNSDIEIGDFRSLNLELAPFNLENAEVLFDYKTVGGVKRIYLYKNPNL